jgi:uncharacterized membrane protein YcaP (DUF421 family)
MTASIVDALVWLFGNDAPRGPLEWRQIVARAAAVYVAGLVIIRVGKSRLLSRATPLDVILAFILGSVLSRGINGSAALSGTIVAATTLVFMHWIFTALACRSHRLGNLIKGQPRLVISNGQLQWDNMRRSHITEHDLREELRLNANIEDFNDVKAAYKERSGEVGVVRRQSEPKIVEIAVEAGVQTVRVILAEKSNDADQPRAQSSFTEYPRRSGAN